MIAAFLARGPEFVIQTVILVVFGGLLLYFVLYLGWIGLRIDLLRRKIKKQAIAEGLDWDAMEAKAKAEALKPHREPPSPWPAEIPPAPKPDRW